MSKVINYYWDEAEKAADQVIADYATDKISEKDATTKLLNIEAKELIDIDEYNVEEVLYYGKEDYLKMQKVSA